VYTALVACVMSVPVGLWADSSMLL